MIGIGGLLAEWSTSMSRLDPRNCYASAYNRTFTCMEANYPLCHKEPARSKQRPELVLYGIRELA